MRRDALLGKLLGLWLASFAGLLGFLYALMIGSSVGGRTMLDTLLR